MAAQTRFTRFCIQGLHGQKTIDAQIKDNTLIIVGENGSGKTTLLRMLFYFLSGRWHALSQFQFDSITAIINNQKFELKSDEISTSAVTYDQSLLSHLPLSARRRLRDAEAHGRMDEVAMILQRYIGPSTRVQYSMFDEHARARLTDLQAKLTSEIDAQILYLPTYRRIERELSSIFQGLDIEEMRRPIDHQSESDDSYIELVEFGMGDVQRAINAALDGIRGFANTGLNSLTLSYLGDVVSQNYQSTALGEITKMSDDTILSVLNRISSTILRDDHKKRLREIVLSARTSADVPTEHEQIILHYFTKLLKFQADLQKREGDIRSFCELTSHYIIDKKFVYDTQRFSFRIEWSSTPAPGRRRRAESIPQNERAGDVRLSDLSSGEKQIVSLFSHLYLSGREQYFVLIDEPELSLSVPWQRRFLEDIKEGSFCAGLIAATHSPFIYDNSLRPRTHALGEFLRGPDWGDIQ